MFLMKLTLRLFFLLCILFGCSKNVMAQPALPDLANVTQNGINILTWSCQYDGVKTIIVQRSTDSNLNYVTIGYVRNTAKGVQYFLDGHAKPGSKSLIFYVNDSDGDTVIFKNRWRNTDPGELVEDIRIKPKAGSAVLFDSDLYHASSSPTEGIRVVLNFIFWRKENNPSDQLGLPPIPNIPIGIGKGFHGL
jgi:hypothetical protein